MKIQISFIWSYKKIVPVLIFLLFFSIPVQANDSESDTFNEDDLFSESDMIIDKDELLDDSVASDMKISSISLSGVIYSNNNYSTVRDDYILKSPSTDYDGEYSGSLTSNLLLDMRHKENLKGFINVDFINYFRGIDEPNKTNKIYADVALREAFLDINKNKKIYFRFGRQYLKWGRNYFWNPTDLINVDKKDFLDPDKNLQGTRGVKIHTPFGTKYNIYSFINLEDYEHFKDISWSGKFEFLVGDTEMAFSGWYKKGFEPVWGYDISTRILQIDFRGEASLSHGENNYSLLRTIDSRGNKLYQISQTKNRWIPRASVGFTKSYNIRGVDDRLTIIGEFYYNRSGYSYNVFENPESLTVLLKSGLYEPNHVSKYYGALFTSIKKIIISEISFNANIIMNLVDNSSMLFTSIEYNPFYDFTIDFTVSASLGDGRDEYTFAGNDIGFGIEFRLLF